MGPFGAKDLDLFTESHHHTRQRATIGLTDRGVLEVQKSHSRSVEKMEKQGQAHSATQTLSVDSVTY